MGQRARWQLEAFHEAQREVSLGTDFFLSSPIRDDSVDAVLPADRLDVSGGRLTLAWFSGVDPNGLILTGRLQAEAAVGDASYRRAWAKASAAHPLPFDLAGAVEVAAGSLWGNEPVQRNFFLGGAATLRGLDANQIFGPSFWHARAEVASGFEGARIGLFTDAGWVGPRKEFALRDPWVSVGVGASLLDGIFRFDVSRAVRREQRWKVQLYLDGLF
jgi:hemolysin activation/secretion protein